MLVHTRTHLVALLFMIMLGLGGTQAAAAADSAAIDLTDQPEGTVTSLPPNILLAIDDSGSMDLETLFPTPDGGLYWNKSAASFVDHDGNYYGSSGTDKYFYLFPNGCIQQGDSSTYDRRVQCDFGYHAIPPLPAYAFARSPDYNKAYFNPAADYEPWPDSNDHIFNDSDPKNARYDPVTGNNRIDLTTAHEARGDNEEFYLQPGMTIPIGISYYHTKTGASLTTYTCTNPFNSSITYQPSKTEIKNQRCEQTATILFIFTRQYEFSSKTTNGATITGFQSDEKPLKISQSAAYYAISYFPATFYVADPLTELPATYASYKPSGIQIGQDVNGNKLYGYEIKPENFTDQQDYTEAIQNFANWFTYYRKRHLALRGSAASAFEKIGDARVGAITINDRHLLAMSDLNSTDALSNFLDTIYNIDFTKNNGTPNREALQFLGQQLQSNKQKNGDQIITSVCQRNSAILFTDGYNSTGPLGDIGNVDQTSQSQQIYGTPFGDSHSNTMADIAMKFYEELGQPGNGLADQGQGYVPTPSGCSQATPPASLDCEQKLHMTTYGVTLGQEGNLFHPDEDQAPYDNPPQSWPDPGMTYPQHYYGGGGKEQIDDLWHAAINSRGALLNASSPEKLAKEFTNALNQILGQNETLTNATGNSTSLTADSAVFQTQYSTSDWTGDLIAFNAVNGSTAASNRLWSAASKLADVAKADASDKRTIITALGKSNTSTGSNVSGMPFTVTGLSGAGYSSLTPDAISYLRGDSELEQTGADDDQSKGRIYRDRGNTVLGDIINSVPVYVGTPNPLQYAGTWEDKHDPDAPTPENDASTPYYGAGNGSSFVSENATRPPMVYVGANDGMLHGFDAKTGDEKLAYIPNTLLGSLAGGSDPLTSPAYTHRSFVDGQIATGPAFFKGKGDDVAEWHTVLVGGLRNGGNAIYALDVTDPGNFNPTGNGNASTTAADRSAADRAVLWEFTDSDLGKTYGTPSIVRLHDGHWAAIFANGYNSADHGASLYVVNIANGSLIGDAPIETNATPAPNQQGNGLATPFPVDIDGDHITDYVYAGDLYGNVWRFDLTSNNAHNWSVQKVFQAKLFNGSPQPITTQVQVAAHPNGISYGVMIYFGTGQDIQPLADDDSTVPNSFYGIWDPDVISYDPGSGAPARPSNSTVDRGQLVAQSVSTIEPENGVDGLSYRTVSDDPITYVNDDGGVEDRGWVIDLPEDSGEAILNPPTIVDDNVEFTTTVINRQTCSLTSSGYFMAVSRVNGGPAAEDIFDVNGDSVVDDKDATDQRVAGVGFGSESGSPGQGPSFNDLTNGTQVIKTPLTGGGAATITLARDFLNGRRSWHEIRR